MRMQQVAAIAFSVTVSTAVIAPAAAAAPTTGSAPSAAARSLADADGFDEILRDGLTLLHQRETMATTPVIGKGPTRSDFDGDGRDDIATTADGGVTITYSSAPHRDLLRTVMPGNGCVCFGMQLVGGDFNGDNYDDLAISDYDEVDLNEMGYHAGAVWIFSGGPDGLRVKTVKHINQSTAGVPGASLEPDRFGRALAAGDITGDGRDDLAVGIPGKRIGRAKEAGAVLVLKGSATGITAAGARLITQHTGGVPGTPESGDAFGRSVAVGKINKDKYRDLIVGAPAEDEYAGDGSGLITQFWGSASGVSLSKVSMVSGNAATHAADREGTHLWYLGSALAVTDTDGDGYGEVIVGVGRAQAGSGWEVQPGAVVSFAGRGTGLATKGLKVFSQDSAGIADSTESDDYFGDTVAVGDVTGDGLGDVLVGVPGEDVGKAVDAGMVVLLRGTRSGLTGAGSQSLTQNSSTVPDAAENGDEFGLSTAVLNLDGTGRLHALVGAPHERLQGDAGITPAGTITRFSGGPDGLRAGTATSGLDRWGEAGRRYGTVLVGP